MKHRWLIPLLLLSLGLNVGLLVVRFSPPPPPPPPPEMGNVLREHLSRMTEHLGLSEKQQNKLQPIYDRFFPEILKNSSRARQIRREITASYAARQMDAAKLKGLLEGLKAAHGELDTLMAETILQEASILSAEQRRVYLEKMPWSRSGRGAGSRIQGKP